MVYVHIFTWPTENLDTKENIAYNNTIGTSALCHGKAEHSSQICWLILSCSRFCSLALHWSVRVVVMIDCINYRLSSITEITHSLDMCKFIIGIKTSKLLDT